MRPGAAVALLAGIGFFLSGDASLATVLVEPMKRDLDLGDVQVGLVQGTAFGLAFAAAAVPMGRLIDRRDRVGLLRWGLGGWVAGMAAMAAAHGVSALVAARMVLGVVAALLVPAALSLIADLVPPERRAGATSRFIAGQAAGQAAGVLVGGLVLDRLASAGPAMAPWRLLYLLAAAGGLPLLLLLFRLAEPARRELRRAPAGLAAALSALAAERRLLVPLLAAMLLVQMSMQASSVWTPPVLVRRFALRPGDFAPWLGAVLLGGGITGALIAGRLGDLARGRGGVLWPAAAASFAMAPLAGFALAGTVPMFAALLALYMTAGAAVVTLGTAAITLLVPGEVRGLALGANVLASALVATAAAPVAVAAVSGMLGGEARLAPALALVGAPALFGAALLLLHVARVAGRPA